MRTTLFIAVLILNVLCAGFASAQTKQLAPVPGDPLELATGPATIADTPEKRSAILNLLERARQNNNLHVVGMNPFDLKASFNSSGSAGNSGPGVLEESWLSGATWRWSEHLGTYSQLRIFRNGFVCDSNPGLSTASFADDPPGNLLARRRQFCERRDPSGRVQLERKSCYVCAYCGTARESESGNGSTVD